MKYLKLGTRKGPLLAPPPGDKNFAGHKTPSQYCDFEINKKFSRQI